MRRAGMLSIDKMPYVKMGYCVDPCRQPSRRVVCAITALKWQQLDEDFRCQLNVSETTYGTSRIQCISARQ